MIDPPRYVIISPVRDEESNIAQTLDSVVSQTWRPRQWIIVDDGSSDRTAEIVAQRVEQEPWITLVRRPDRGHRAAGSGVIEAFYDGYVQIAEADWEFLVKLDGDLTFDATYFESCLSRFAADRQLGVAGGVIYNDEGGRLVQERHPSFHVRGATKIYRRETWDVIGGLIRYPGWDILDEVSANYHGYRSKSFTDLHLVQLRYTGGAAGQFRNWTKNGLSCYLVGYHPLFVLARAGLRWRRKPYLVASIGLLWGFWKPWVLRRERPVPDEIVSYVQDQQLRRLTGRPTIWT